MFIDQLFQSLGIFDFKKIAMLARETVALRFRRFQSRECLEEFFQGRRIRPKGDQAFQGTLFVLSVPPQPTERSDFGD